MRNFFFLQPILDEEDDDDIDNLFLAVTIISTIEIEKTHLDLNGLYHCVGIHNEIYSVQNFDVHVIANGKVFHPTGSNLSYFSSRNKFNSNKFFRRRIDYT
jgi:hypothetical protein